MDRLDPAIIDKLAQAVGQPKPYAIERGSVPYKHSTRDNRRNGYLAGIDEDPDWVLAENLGLAERGNRLNLWHVTEKGDRTLCEHLFLVYARV